MAKNPYNKIRLMKKAKILGYYPFIDHSKIYAFKYKCQKGQPKESQTFILSYTYNYDHFIKNKEAEFIIKLNNLNLSFYKESCIFREKKSYRILIMDTEVDKDYVLKLLSIE